MKPYLSIITPVFNSVGFIEKCLNNVIEQNGDDAVEHIIVDGGSTDGTLDVIRHYAKKYSHIRFISEPDNGQSDAMNKGINLANATHIGFLNADDFYSPFTLKRILTLISRDKAKRVWVGNCKLINAEGDLIYINRPKRLRPYHLYAGLPFPINPVAYFYDKTIHEHPKVGLYNVHNHFNMDYEFFLKTCLYYSMVYFNEDWGYMVEHQDAKTALDKQRNEIYDRKKALLRHYWQSAPIRVRAKASAYQVVKSYFL